MNYRPEIDGLRAIAVMSVLLYHVGFTAIGGGYVGVDIFFVISGFLISSILLKEFESGTFLLSGFYERRCRRILPPVVFMAIIVVPISTFMILLDFAGFSKSLVAVATFWANIFFYQKSGYFDSTSEFMPFLHTWSLSVEEQFYLFFPIILLLIYKFARKRLMLAVIVLASASFISSIVFIIHSPEAVFYLTHFRAWELLAGAIVALMPQRRFSRVVLLCLSIFSLCLLLIPVFVFDSNMRFPGFSALPPVLGAAMFIHIHKQGISESVIGCILARPIPVAIGKISYALYLWHWPIFTLYRIVYGSAGFEPLWVKLGLIALAFMMAIISTKFIEAPVRARRLFKDKKTVLIASLVSILALASLSKAIYFIDVPFRRDFRAYVKVRQYPKSSSCSLAQSWDWMREECRLGSVEATPSFMLLGDSHAGAWMPGIDAIASEYGIGGYPFVMPGCDPVDFGKSECKRSMAAAEDAIKSSGVTDVVVARMARMERIRNQYLAPLFDKFRSLGVNVWYVEPVPVFSELVPHMLLRKWVYGVDIKPAMKRGVEMYQQDHIPEDLDNVTILWHQPRICTESICMIDDGKEPFYSDDDHLSIAGAIYYKNTFAPLFEDLRRRSNQNQLQVE